MAAVDGEFLGAEEEIRNRLGVSRPTLRQAAALVAEEQLLVIRRGMGGGYFARRPDTSTVTRIAAIYLQSRRARLEEIIRAVEPIRVELARLATRNRDAAATEQLRAFLQEERTLDGRTVSYAAFLKAERTFGKVLGRASGSQVLTLFLDILYDLAGRLGHEEDIYVNHPERVQKYRAYRNQMAEAIAERDEEMAVLAAKRCSAAAMAWMKLDLAGERFGSDMHESPIPAQPLRRAR